VQRASHERHEPRRMWRWPMSNVEYSVHIQRDTAVTSRAFFVLRGVHVLPNVSKFRDAHRDNTTHAPRHAPRPHRTVTKS
jgi:hypothetical protein